MGTLQTRRVARSRESLLTDSASDGPSPRTPASQPREADKRGSHPAACSSPQVSVSQERDKAGAVALSTTRQHSASVQQQADRAPVPSIYLLVPTGRSHLEHAVLEHRFYLFAVAARRAAAGLSLLEKGPVLASLGSESSGAPEKVG